jgi:cytochrome c-type biogenesis protein
MEGWAVTPPFTAKMFANLSETSLITAFLAGLLSFVSPCVQPLVPSYMMYLSGLSFQQLAHSETGAAVKHVIVMNAVLFILGFSAVFIMFGASASVLGQVLMDHQDVLRKAGAILMILFGLHISGMIKLTWLMTERRLHLTARPAGPLASFLIGGTFAAGWTPCVGPILGTMLLYAATTDTLLDGVTLLAFYSLGLGVPLLIASLALNRFLSFLQEIKTSLPLVSGVSGVFLIMMGIVMYLDRFSLLTAFFERYGVGVYLGTDGG